MLYRDAMEPPLRSAGRSYMRPAAVVLLVTLTSVTLLPLGQEAATASCAAPYITNAERIVLRQNSIVEVRGSAFANGCQDTGGCSITFGCTSCSYGPEPTPMVDIKLSLQQRGRTWPVGIADARSERDDFGEVTWAVEIPNGVERGSATLVPESGEPTKVRIR